MATIKEMKAAVPFRSWYVLGVLTFFYIFSFLDRNILALLVEPMREDLGWSDLQLSYLGGFSFVIFYTFFGIPIGRLSDSRGRRGIIALGVFLWSLSTTLCGFASRFWHFLILRMGVGIGEAALSPAAYSLITDLFPREKLATAMSLYSTGAALGIGLSYLGGALILDWANSQAALGPGLSLPLLGVLQPWQVVFLAVGLPGICLFGLLFTFKEPVRKRFSASSHLRTDSNPENKASLGESLQYLRQNWRTLAFHNLGMAFFAVAMFAAAFWDLAFISRTYAIAPEKSGLWYGLIAMAGQAAGNFSGGLLADRLTRKGIRGSTLIVMLFAALAWLPFGLAYPLMPSASWCFLMLVPAHFFTGMPFGCAAAAIQVMVPPRMRGQASAVYLFVMNIIGMGLGPTSVAVLTEHVFSDSQMLRYSLFTVGLAAHLLSALFIFLAFESVREILPRIEACSQTKQSRLWKKKR